MKNRFIIVGAGSICPGDLHFKKEPGDFLCAADAGFKALTAAGFQPDLVIGDFDSMAENALFQRYKGTQGAETPEIPFEVIRLPVEKDDTDIVFCVKEGFRRGYTDFVIFGALGGSRLSHTVANLQLLTMIRDGGGNGKLIAGNTAVFLMKGGETKSFPAGLSGILSVFSLTEESELSLAGLFYPLDHGILTRHFPLGVSNHFTEAEARITVHRGEILVIIESPESV
ncbi:MAG: thiamine diphosphokinase [Lachnospiraceae bacterium]|nr:thiamine diphosphokinase [Lachnospiraceae bacterium]